MTYWRERRSKRNPERKKITRSDALSLLAGGRPPGIAAWNRLLRIEHGDAIDPKFSMGFVLTVTA